MLEGLQRAFLHFQYVINEPFRSSRCLTESKRVDEHTDDQIEIGMRSPCYRCADDNVVLTAVFRE
ncbi:hypothetical protein D3C71_2100870 [compost metagenome]